MKAGSSMLVISLDRDFSNLSSTILNCRGFFYITYFSLLAKIPSTTIYTR